MEKVTCNEAYHQGYADYNDGHDATDIPHYANSTLKDLWFEGWKQAQFNDHDEEDEYNGHDM